MPTVSQPAPIRVDGLINDGTQPYTVHGQQHLSSMDGSIAIDTASYPGMIDLSATGGESFTAALLSYHAALQTAVATATDFASLQANIANLSITVS
jgi:hypothetical protein